MAILDSTGKRIRAIMADLDMRGSDVVRELEKRGVSISRSQLSNVVTGRRNPSVEVLAGLSSVLDCTADYLLLLTDNPSRPADDVPVLGISQEAEDAANMIDGMDPAQRRAALDVVRSIWALDDKLREQQLQTAQMLMQIRDALPSQPGQRLTGVLDEIARRGGVRINGG